MIKGSCSQSQIAQGVSACGRRLHLALCTVVFSALLMACSDGSDGMADAMGPPLSEPVEKAYTFGSWAVGHQRLEAIDVNRGNRQLPYDVWYPVDAEDAMDEPRTVYPLQGGAGLTAERAVEGLPVSSSGDLPLLVFSHGSGGTNTQSVLLMETLASHGFVVVSPEHTGNTNDDFSDTPAQAAARRVPDISFMIDTFLARNEIRGDEFFQRLDPDEALAAVEEPVLFLGGTLDTAVPIENHDYGFDRLTGAEAVFQVDIVGATHTHFANICDIGNWLIDNGIGQDLWPAIGAAALLEPYRDTCSDEAFPIDEVLRIQNLYAVAFFRRYLLGETAYEYYLRQDYARDNEPYVAFRARML
jgi:predicted dienelactone hydrolase